LISLLLLAARPLLLVHVMPWFAVPPVSTEWGWHWTMGKRDAANGELASHYRPLSGPYDSGDPDLIDLQTSLMKLAGFDGMLVDWYGDRDRYDYLSNHRNTQALFEGAQRAGLSFALVYEDQTVPNLISGGVFAEKDAVAEGKALFERAAKAWFGSPTYQRIGGKPLLMVFGPQYYPEAAWAEMLPDTAFYTLHHRRAGAVGAYDWPLPGDAWRSRRAEIGRESSLIPVAFPRFHDYYKAAGAGEGYGLVPDEDGKTYRTTLEEAVGRGAPVVQVATWNDWGEGTQIEPSREFGYRDLETTQSVRRRLDPGFPFRPSDLRLPLRVYRLRKEGKGDPERLAAVSALILAGKTSEARKMLDQAVR
jgi:hypothetical protein